MFNSPVGDRLVTSITVNDNGYVTHLWNDRAEWPPQSAADAIVDMELGIHAYYVEWPDGVSEVVDATDAGGRYLRSTHDNAHRNSLLDLPHHPGEQHRRA